MSGAGSSGRTAIHGYADRFSAAGGEGISFHVSTENVPSYEATLVRLLHGYDGPGGAGLLEEEVPSSVNKGYHGETLDPHSGSHVDVTDPQGMLRGELGLRIRVNVMATAPASGRQGLMGRWDEGSGAGYALLVDDGHLALVAGGHGSQLEARLREPLAADAWYAVEASIDPEAGKLALSARPLRSLSDLVQPAALGLKAERHAAGGACTPRAEAPFRLAALSIHEGHGWAACCHFNGRLDGPRVSALGHSGAVKAEWDLGASDRRDGLLLDAVVDRGPHHLHGRCVNAPTRGVRGPNWKGKVDDFQRARGQFGAIHFHDDDIEDAAWPAAFTLKVPRDLPSGVYAMRLRGGNAEEHIPFFARPGVGVKRNRVAVLFPTGSYLAYANDHLPFDNSGAELLIGHSPVLHDDDLQLQEHYDYGRSCYEVHNDGSGVILSSRRRPILNMRPRYRCWFMAEGPWQFPADLEIVQWLEGEGIAFDAITDEDVHREGVELLRQYEVVLTGSHPEYPSTRQVEALETYLGSGGKLMYLGGNGFYWMVSYHPEKPWLMEIRRSESGSRPHQAPPGEQVHQLSGERCGMWRNKGRAPQRLVGVGYGAEGFDRSTYYERLPDSFDPRASWIFEGVGPQERIGDFGIMGGGAAGAEVDKYDVSLGSPPGALVLASSAMFSDNYQHASEELLETPPGLGGTMDPAVRSDLVYFTLEGGGAVFSVGSIAWTGSLNHKGGKNNVARITGNVLRGFLEGH